MALTIIFDSQDSLRNAAFGFDVKKTVECAVTGSFVVKPCPLYYGSSRILVGDLGV